MYIEAWEQHFLPYLRVVNVQGLPAVLSPAEQLRLDHCPDRDDVPSATLALALGAVFLSEDGDPHFAVYGRATTYEERAAWLELLAAGSDVREYHWMSAIASAPAVMSIVGLWKAGEWLWEQSNFAEIATSGACTD